MTTSAESSLRVVRIVNPVDPRQVEHEAWELAPGATLATYFPSTATEEWVVSVNGRLIPERDFAVTELCADDWLVVCPVLHGGGSDKNKAMLRIVAMIAVVAVAAWAAPGVAGMFGGAISAGTAKIGLTMAGSVLVNALLPPPKPNSKSRSDAASYGIDNQKNTAAEGIQVPIIYGTIRSAGNLVNLYVENEGRTQWVHMLYVVSEGPIANIGGILINDQPIANFSDVQVDLRLGDALQQPMGWFANTVSPASVSRKLADGSNWVNYTTSQQVDALRLDFVAPAGLADYRGSNPASISVPVEVQYKLTSSSTWLSLPNAAIVTQTVVRYFYDTFALVNGVWTRTGSTEQAALTPGDWVWNDVIYRSVDNGEWGTTSTVVGRVVRETIRGTGLVMTDNTTSAVRQSLSSGPIPQGVYNVRARRLSPDSADTKIQDDVWLSDINEIVTDPVGYRNTALLGIKVRLTDQLSGLPNVTALVTGRMVSVWAHNTDAWRPNPVATSNPAWIAWDILTNTRYGAGIDPARLDLEQWKAWSAYCLTEGLTFDGILGNEGSVWDTLMVVARCGRASLVNIGTRWSVAIERPDNPVMMFSVANMVRDSFKLDWAGSQDRANELEITYTDREANYQQKTIRVYDPAALSSGAKPKSAAITLQGVTSYERAYREAVFQLNLNRHIIQSCEFATTLEALGCTVGDVILVQHDMPQWGAAGRLEAGSTTTLLKLDRPVTMSAGKSYRVLLVLDSVLRVQSTVSSVSVSTIGINGFNGTGSIRRARVNGRDLEVTGIYNGGVRVPSTQGMGIAVGQAVELWDTDVLEERTVANAVDTVSEINVTPALGSAPAALTHFMFGEVGKVKKPFRVKSITANMDGNRTVSAIEYNASVYDLSGVVVPTPNYSSLQTFAEHSTITGATERLVAANNAIATEVTVAFTNPQTTYSHSQVYVSVNGAAEYLLDGRAFSQAKMFAPDGANLVFRVVAVDAVGAEAARSRAPTIAYTVIGKSAPPATVASVSWTTEEYGVRLAWARVADLDLASYEIRVGSTWESAAVIAQVDANNFLWRIQTLGTHRIHVRAVDTGGRYSDASATTDVVIGSPAAVSLSARIDGQTVVLGWGLVAGAFTIDRYEIRTGPVWQTGAFVADAYTTSFTAKALWLGPRRYWVAAVDAAGNVGNPVSVDVTIAAPAAPVLTSEVIDNNVLLRWSDSTTTLPVDRYDIRRGDTYATGSSVGDNGNGRFAVFFEQAAGTYTYWIVAYDTAGNASAASSLSVKVNQPPDYALTQDFNSTFSGTRFGIATELSRLYAPMREESFRHHFTSQGWTTPQDQVDRGFAPYFSKSGGFTVALTADRLIETATTGEHHLSRSVSMTAGLTYAFSIYARPAERTRIRLENALQAVSADFDLVAGTVIATAGTTNATITAAGDGWFRIGFTLVASATASREIRVGLMSGASVSYAGTAGFGAWLFGAQIEVAGASSDYQATDASTGSRNLFTLSERFDQAAWVKTAATVEHNTATAPPLVTLPTPMTGDRIRETTATGAHRIDQVIPASSVPDGSTVTISVWVRPAGRPVQMRVLRKDNVGVQFKADFETNVVEGTASATNRVMVPVGGGVYRIGFTVALNTGTTSPSLWIGCGLPEVAVGTFASFAGNTEMGFEFLAAQVQFGSVFTEFQATGATAGSVNLLRHADSADNAVWGKTNVTAVADVLPGPGSLASFYEEVFDCGGEVPGAQISASLTTRPIAGQVEITPQISFKTLAADPWTQFPPGVVSVYGSGFRFVRVRYDFAASTGADLVEVANLNVKVAMKMLNDGGSGHSNAADAGGTWVAFRQGLFTDVNSITVSPLGSTTPVIAIYDFLDAPNPTGFRVLLFNTSGARVSGSFSWSAKGV
jgi:predicted phage tail protein/sulfur carrier protein ThiS